MNYLIVQDWASTSGNHAGMLHMCKLLKNEYPSEFEIYVLPIVNSKFLKFLKIFNLTSFYSYLKCLELYYNLKKNLELTDNVILLEYLHIHFNQYFLLKFIQRDFPSVKVFGLAHLTSNVLDFMFNDTKLHNWINPLDKLFTFGSSLNDYLVKRGISKNKIINTLHYVDDNYYECNRLPNYDSTLKVLLMGNMQRDYSVFKEIATSCPYVEFYICLGKNSSLFSFSDLNNVKCFGYLKESELKEIMAKCDVSLNVMLDTIGSNVIVTSMSMGLAMVVSDVGSIRDYCPEEDCFYCKSSINFIDSIHQLNSNRDLLFKFQKASKLRSKWFNINSFYTLLN